MKVDEKSSVYALAKRNIVESCTISIIMQIRILSLYLRISYDNYRS